MMKSMKRKNKKTENERMIFNDRIYRFKFIDNSMEEMLDYGVTVNDIIEAFTEDEEQREYFEEVQDGSFATLSFSDANDFSIIIKKEGNILNVIKIY